MRARFMLVALALVAAGCSNNKSDNATAPTSPSTTTTTSVEPVLGWEGWAHGAEGFGVARPAKVFNGGDPLGYIDAITWTSWGGATAQGDGQSFNADDSSDGSVAGAPKEPAHIVAWDLGDCHGRLGYRKVAWYFKGAQWKASDDSYDLCKPL